MREGISNPLEEVLQVPLSTPMQLKLLHTPASLQFRKLYISAFAFTGKAAASEMYEF